VRGLVARAAAGRGPGAMEGSWKKRDRGFGLWLSIWENCWGRNRRRLGILMRTLRLRCVAGRKGGRARRWRKLKMITFRAFRHAA